MFTTIAFFSLLISSGFVESENWILMAIAFVIGVLSFAIAIHRGELR